MGPVTFPGGGTEGFDTAHLKEAKEVFDELA
jgi:hypothetical protein